MTKLLDLAIEKIRALSEADQDDTAEMLLSVVEAGSRPLDAEAAAAIDEGMAQAARGEFAPEAEVAALWRRHGL